MFVQEKFNYDGINSDDMNIYIVRVGSGMIQGQFGLNRSLVKEIIPNNHLSNHFGFDYAPLTFSLQLYSPEPWTLERKMVISKWLFQNSYKPFYSYDNIDIIYYCTPINQPIISITGNYEGTVEVIFECNAPYAFSPTIMQTFDLSDNDYTREIQLISQSNLLDYKHFPEVEVTLVDDSTGFSLKNLSDGGLTQTFSNLSNGETVYIDNKNKIIKSNLSGIYRYSNFNKVWTQLIFGVNRIQVTGKCKIKVRSKFPIIS